MQKIIGKTTLRLVTGDIADQDTDAVVTAAHWRLNKGVGTDGTIHSKGGRTPPMPKPSKRFSPDMLLMEPPEMLPRPRSPLLASQMTGLLAWIVH